MWVKQKNIRQNNLMVKHTEDIVNKMANLLQSYENNNHKLKW